MPRRVIVLCALALVVLAAACRPQVSAPSSSDPFAVWRPFLECTIDHESRSSGVYETDTGNGYFGAYQFVFSTWSGAITRAGYPLLAGTPPVAPTVDAFFQDAAAVQLASERGAQPWGNRCGELLP